MPERRELALQIGLIGIVMLGVGLFLAAEKRIAGTWGFSLDDAWIHAVIARNLATGHGYSFNPGEWVGGSTSPLFTILLALVYRILGDMVWSAKLIGILFQSATAAVVFNTMAKLNPGRRALPFAAGVAVGIFPSLLWASLSGMEISAYLFVVALGFYYYVGRRFLAATVVWSLGIWFRPDGAFLALLGVAASRDQWPRRLSIAALIAAAYVSFNLTVGHHPLPQSVEAKTALTFAVFPRLTRVLQEWANLWGLAVLLLLIGAAATFRKAPLLALYCLGFPVVWSIFAGSTGIGSRYVLPVIPAGVILAIQGAESLSNKLPATKRTIALAALLSAFLGWEALGAIARAESHAWNVQNINGMQRSLGEEAKALTRPGDALAVNDIGAIGYFSERYIVDLMGLISPLHSLPEDLSLYKPRLLIIFPDWFHVYTIYDPVHNNTYYLDADSTHQYSALFLVELRHKTVVSRSKMMVFVRQTRGDPPPPERWKYIH